MSDHLKGLLITTLGVLFLVPDSLFVRLIGAEALAIAFWRGLIAGGLVLGFVLIRSGTGPVRAVLRGGPPVYAYMALYGVSAPGFVLAVSMTSVANVVFILAAMPVFAAVFSRIWLGEVITRRMVWTMLGVFLGLSIIVLGSTAQPGTNWRGDALALLVAACFAAALTAARRARGTPMLPAVPLALIGGAVLMLPFVDIWGPLPAWWPLFAAHGLFIAFASGLMVLGPRYVSSAEVALLILLESILAPLLVWAVIGENPGPWALAGGAVVVVVLMISNAVVLLRRGPGVRGDAGGSRHPRG